MVNIKPHMDKVLPEDLAKYHENENLERAAGLRRGGLADAYVQNWGADRDLRASAERRSYGGSARVMNPFQTAGAATGLQPDVQLQNTQEHPVPLRIHSSDGPGVSLRFPDTQPPPEQDLYSRPSSRNERLARREDYFSFDGEGERRDRVPEASSLQNCIMDRPDPYKELRDNLAQKNQDLRSVMAPQMSSGDKAPQTPAFQAATPSGEYSQPGAANVTGLSRQSSQEAFGSAQHQYWQAGPQLMKVSFDQKEKAPSQYFQQQVNFIAQINKAQEIKNARKSDPRSVGMPPYYQQPSTSSIQNVSSSVGWLLPDATEHRSSSHLLDPNRTMSHNPWQPHDHRRIASQQQPAPSHSFAGGTLPPSAPYLQQTASTRTFDSFQRAMNQAGNQLHHGAPDASSKRPPSQHGGAARGSVNASFRSFAEINRSDAQTSIKNRSSIRTTSVRR